MENDFFDFFIKKLQRFKLHVTFILNMFICCLMHDLLEWKTLVGYFSSFN